MFNNKTAGAIKAEKVKCKKLLLAKSYWKDGQPLD
jgi:hypothetical protein